MLMSHDNCFLVKMYLLFDICSIKCSKNVTSFGFNCEDFLCRRCWHLFERDVASEIERYLLSLCNGSFLSGVGDSLLFMLSKVGYFYYYDLLKLKRTTVNK